VHINLTGETHTALKITAFKNRLSMQEIFEALAIQIVEEDPRMIKILQQLATNKKEKALKQLSKTDAESIFKVIETDNPLMGK